jgi:uncharacterized LabA/DUF88 family protein
MSKERVIVFIDGSNQYHIIKDIIGDADCLSNFEFEKFIRYLVGDRDLIRVYYYTAPLDKNYIAPKWAKETGQKTYAKQQQFFEKLKKIPFFSLILCRMQKGSVEEWECKNCGNKDTKRKYFVKEDDIHLAVDMVKLSYNKAYDTAILVSSDGDFIPAIKIVKEMGNKVENIGFERKFSWHLKHECDRYRQLSDDDVKSFFSGVQS